MSVDSVSRSVEGRQNRAAGCAGANGAAPLCRPPPPLPGGLWTGAMRGWEGTDMDRTAADYILVALDPAGRHRDSTAALTQLPDGTRSRNGSHQYMPTPNHGNAERWPLDGDHRPRSDRLNVRTATMARLRNRGVHQTRDGSKSGDRLRKTTPPALQPVRLDIQNELSPQWPVGSRNINGRAAQSAGDVGRTLGVVNHHSDLPQPSRAVMVPTILRCPPTAHRRCRPTDSPVTGGHAGSAAGRAPRLPAVTLPLPRVELLVCAVDLQRGLEERHVLVAAGQHQQPMQRGQLGEQRPGQVPPIRLDQGCGDLGQGVGKLDCRPV